jgi:hypothetical protein
VEPRRIADALSFHPIGNGNLAATLDRAKPAGVVDKLSPTEKPGQDARMDFSGGQPVVTPSSNGRVIDWDKTLVQTGAGKTGVHRVRHPGDPRPEGSRDRPEDPDGPVQPGADGRLLLQRLTDARRPTCTIGISREPVA